jgi:hypothetical protein
MQQLYFLREQIDDIRTRKKQSKPRYRVRPLTRYITDTSTKPDTQKEIGKVNKARRVVANEWVTETRYEERTNAIGRVTR